MSLEKQGYDAQEMLSQVDRAIYSVLRGGQSYHIGSKELTRADLGLLRSMKNELTTQIASDRGNGLLDNTYVAFFDGR